MGTLIPEDDDTMTLSFDDGAEIECAVIAVFPVGERNYIALLPFEDQGVDEDEVYIYRFIGAENAEDVQLEDIETDEEWEMVSDAFDELLDSEEFDELFDGE